MTIRKYVKIIGIALLIWAAVFVTDRVAVEKRCKPIFCIETAAGHYTGLGYAFDCAVHPITGKNEYALEIFGIPVYANFTN